MKYGPLVGMAAQRTINLSLGHSMVKNDVITKTELIKALKHSFVPFCATM